MLATVFDVGPALKNSGSKPRVCWGSFDHLAWIIAVPSIAVPPGSADIAPGVRIVEDVSGVVRIVPVVIPYNNVRVDPKTL